MGTTILLSIMAIWQNKGGYSYSFLTAEGSQAAFCFATALGIVILYSYWRMFSLEKVDVNRKNSL